jgi:hypothetical protein
VVSAAVEIEYNCHCDCFVFVVVSLLLFYSDTAASGPRRSSATVYSGAERAAKVVQHANKETQRNLSHSLSLSLTQKLTLPRLPLLPLGIVHHTESRVGVALRACDPRPPPPAALGRYSAGAVWRLWAHRHTTRAKRIQAVESRHHTQYGGFTRRPLWEGGE